MSDQHFKAASWSMSIKIMSLVGTAILLAVALFVCYTFPEEAPSYIPKLITALCLGTWFLCILSIVKGFDIENGEVVVHRPLWKNRIPFSSGAKAFPKKMPGAIRLLGNGGLFSGSGWFWNKEIGVFHVFITDPNKCVWVQTPQKTIIISPEDPEGFVKAFTVQSMIR